MRTWIEYIISNPAAYADFTTWARAARNNLDKKLKEAVEADNYDEAKGIVHEMNVYETICQKVEVEARERRSQQQQIEGGNE